MKWWLISDEDIVKIKGTKLSRQARHIIDTGLHLTDIVPRDFRFCPECGEFKPDDERVINGMKCGHCAY